MKALQRRLVRLEQRCLPKPEHVWTARVDKHGLVVDDGREEIRPWVGRPGRELPSPVTLISDEIDLRVVLGEVSDKEFFAKRAAAGLPVPGVRS